MRPGRLGAVLVVAGTLAVAASLLGCGPCSSNPGSCQEHARSVPQNATASDDVVCRNEALTGSHIVERRCYRRSDMDERRKLDRAVMERLMIQSNRPVRNPATGTPNPQ
jgi:hypothetical protein